VDTYQIVEDLVRRIEQEYRRNGCVWRVVLNQNFIAETLADLTSDFVSRRTIEHIVEILKRVIHSKRRLLQSHRQILAVVEDLWGHIGRRDAHLHDESMRVGDPQDIPFVAGDQVQVPDDDDDDAVADSKHIGQSQTNTMMRRVEMPSAIKDIQVIDNPLPQKDCPQKPVTNESKQEEKSSVDQLIDDNEAIEDLSMVIPPRECNEFGITFTFGEEWMNDVVPKYKHLKEEMLNNEYAKISPKQWEGVLKKCHKILNGDFTSFRRKHWSRKLRDNKIGMKHLLALKLYTDFDLLQREFRKTYRAPFNEDRKRLESFAQWRKLLEETFSRFNTVTTEQQQPRRLFHGINTRMPVADFSGKNWGPSSTTTDLHVARSFAGKRGMVLVLRPKRTLTETNRFRVLDISWISDYPDEKEYLIFDQEVEVECVILSAEYDRHYHYYHNVLGKNDKKSSGTRPFNALSYDEQSDRTKYLDVLNKLKSEDSKHSVDGAKRKKALEWAVAFMAEEDCLDMELTDDFKGNVRDNLKYTLIQRNKAGKEMKVPSAMMRLLESTNSKMDKKAIRRLVDDFYRC